MSTESLEDILKETLSVPKLSPEQESLIRDILDVLQERDKNDPHPIPPGLYTLWAEKKRS